MSDEIKVWDAPPGGSLFWKVYGPLIEEVNPYVEGLRQRLVQSVGYPLTTAPSREFMVRQSVLNALHEHYKSHIEHLGTAGAMRRLVTQCGWEHETPSSWFVHSVRDHFHKIEAQYHA